MVRRRIAVEVALVALLFVFGVSVGSFASRQFIGQPVFYQGEFGPAVMVALGRGFVNPKAAPGSPLAQFLNLQRPAIAASDVGDLAAGPLDQFQEATRYLMLAVGYGWRLSGISWAAVSSVSGVLFGLTLLACYAIIRTWLSPVFALAGSVLMGLSPLHLAQVPHLRDYSKAPFILFAMALTIAVASRPLSRRALVLLSAACGAVIGIGLGFKMDVFAMTPIFLASLALFRGRRPWTELVDKGVAAGAFLVALVVSAAPVLFHLSQGSNGYHVIVLGYADLFGDDLGLGRQAYTWLPFYEDGYLTSVLSEFGRRTTGVSPGFPSTAYDVAGRAYWFEIIRHFPADILTRALAAANGVLNLLSNTPALNFLVPPVNPGRLTALLTNQPPHRMRAAVLFDWLSIVRGWGAAFGIVLIGAASVRSARLGAFAAWLILVTAGYSSLQFADRHVFHLQIVPIFGLLVTASVAMHWAWFDRRAVQRFAVALAVLALAVVVPVVLLRVYQAAHLARLFRGYIDAPKAAVSSTLEDTGHGTWRVHLSLAPPRIGGYQPAEYYVVEFDSVAPRPMTPVEVHYTAMPGAVDYSRMVSMSETAGVGRLFIPAYGRFPTWTFDGLELPADLKARLRGIYRVDPAARPALLLDLRLRGGWEHDRLYQAFRGEPGTANDDVQIFNQYDGAVSNVAWIGRLDSPETTPRADAVFQSFSKAASVTAAGVEMDGPAESQSSYLIDFKPVDVTGPAALVVRGHLYSGGLSVGLLRNKRWSGQVVIQEPGDFVAVIDIPEQGMLEPIVTNATRRDGDRNHFVLSRFGVVTAESVGR